VIFDPVGLFHPYNMPVYPGALRFADYPGMIGKAYADLRDLPQRNLDRDHSEIGLS